MIDNNRATAGIETDYEIASILSNFSDDIIKDIISESLMYRFRVFGLRMANYPEILCGSINNILNHSTGHDQEIIEKKEDVLRTIINTIAEYYGFQISEEIEPEQLYTVCYIIYQIFVSEFTDRMLNFYTQYIIDNMGALVKHLKSEETSKSVYSKKIYNNQDLGIIYDNMLQVMDVIAGLDIELPELITYLSDKNTSDFLCQYIEPIDDIYKKHFAVFITDPTTKADVVTAVRFKFVGTTMENIALVNPDTNPYIERPEPTSITGNIDNTEDTEE